MFFFFQAEDGIRDVAVTGVQTCALPIYGRIPVVQRQSLRAVLRGPNTLGAGWLAIHFLDRETRKRGQILTTAPAKKRAAAREKHSPNNKKRLTEGCLTSVLRVVLFFGPWCRREICPPALEGLA